MLLQSLAGHCAGGTSFQEDSGVLGYQVHMTLSKAVNFCCEALKNSCMADGVLRK